MTRAIDQGRRAEDLACAYLQARGLRLVQRNFRCRSGELDLVMRDGASIVFVEVRYRRVLRYGSGAESIDHRKQRKLIAAAQYYLLCHAAAADIPARFDVVSISGDGPAPDIQWISNAFPA